MGMVQFCHGADAAKYIALYTSEPSKWESVLFFDTTNKVIYKAGEIYGGSGEATGVMPEQIQSMLVSVEADASNGKGTDYAYTYSFINYAGEANYSITIPIASSEKSGLITPDEKAKLVSINLDNFVIKEDGKGLSSNDFTQEYINTIKDLQELAEPNVIEVVKVNGSPLTVDESDKSVNIDLEELINSRISSAYVYKGSVEEESSLPTSNRNAGDVYNIVQSSSLGPAGINVAWVETNEGGHWDSLGGSFDTSNLESKISGIETNVNNLTSRVGALEAETSEHETDINTIKNFLGEIKEGDSITTIVNDISLTNISNALTWELIE